MVAQQPPSTAKRQHVRKKSVLAHIDLHLALLKILDAELRTAAALKMAKIWKIDFQSKNCPGVLHRAQSLLPENFLKKFCLARFQSYACSKPAARPGCWVPAFVNVGLDDPSVQHHCCQDDEEHWCSGQMTKQEEDKSVSTGTPNLDIIKDIWETRHCLRSVCFVCQEQQRAGTTCWCIFPEKSFLGLMWPWCALPLR